jgi:hypothetical protein
MDVFADDPRPQLHTIRTAATQILRRVEEDAAMAQGAEVPAPVHELGRFVDRLENVLRRWGELRRVFDTEYRTYRTAKDVWERRDGALLEVSKALLAEETARWDKRLDLALRICEGHADSLSEEEPAWIAREITALREIWADLPVRVDAHLAAARAARETAKVRASAARAAPAAPGPGAGVPSRKGLETTSRRAPAQRAAARTVEVETAETETAEMAEVPSRTQARPRGVTSAKPNPEGSSASARSILWALAGFVLASILFLLRGRRSGSQLREPSPPARSA